MTVAELIAELQKLPQDKTACIVYDSRVMCLPVTFARVFSDFGKEDPVVGIFAEKPSERAWHDKNDAEEGVGEF